MWQKPENKEQKDFTYKVRVICFYSFVTVVLIVLVAFLLFRYDRVKQVLSAVGSYIRPVFFGIVLAYLLDPLSSWLQKRFRKLFQKYKHGKKAAKILGITGAILICLGLVVAFLALVIPGLVESIQTLALNFETYVENIQGWIARLQHGSDSFKEYMNMIIVRVSEGLEDWLQNDLTKELTNLLSHVTSGVIDVVTFFFNLAVGLVISVYLLRDKVKVIGQTKKVCSAVFSPKMYQSILDTARQGHRIFGGFIYGKIIDSLIIGVLTFIGLSILKMPYSLLISVIICITNIIPFFGPFLGAVPSAFLILMVDPLKSLYFVIFILVLQQIDGNIIGPRIVGNTIGINEFWVTFSLLLFGGIFGFFGMVIGVPLFGLTYYVIVQLMDRHLRKKGLSTTTSDYYSEGE